MKNIFISDCEGPISKNDNAFELTAHFIPEGDKLFTNISKYDDVLGRRSSKAGLLCRQHAEACFAFLESVWNYRQADGRVFREKHGFNR